MVKVAVSVSEAPWNAHDAVTVTAAAEDLVTVTVRVDPEMGWMATDAELSVVDAEQLAWPVGHREGSS